MTARPRGRVRGTARRRLTAALLAGGLAAALAPAAAAQESPPELDNEPDRETVARELERLQDLEESAVDGADAARAAADDHARVLRSLQREMIESALAIMVQHDTMRAVDQRRAVLEAELAEAEAALAAERVQLGRLVSALQRLGRVPREALLLRPDAPADSVRAALLLRAAVPALERAAGRLQDRLIELTALRRQLDRERRNAEAMRRRLDDRIADLDQLRSERRDLFAEASAEHERLTAESVAVALRADSLRTLMTGLQGGPPPTPDRGTAGDGQAGWEVVTIALPQLDEGVLLPASGDILRAFGDADITGRPLEGVEIAAYPGAPIVAPLDGQVRFAGPFRDYGNILILAHGGEYHSLIIGAGRLDAVAGQNVLAGEPLAVTPSPQSPDNAGPSIYFEFRQDGQPVEPISGLMTARTQG